MNSLKKLKRKRELKVIIDRLKRTKRKIVFTNGCFDLLHPGHIKLLKEAKSKGDYLIVGLNSDVSVKKIKGKKRPIMDQKARAIILNALECIDFIVLFDEPTPYNLIKYLKPHYLVKGEDWKKEDIIGREFVEKVFRIKLLKEYSTTKIIEKIQKKYGGREK